MWPILLLVGAGVLLYKQGTTAADVSISPLRIKFERSGLSINLIYYFAMENLRDTAATIDAVSGHIYAGTNELGTFITQGKINIAPRATTIGAAKVRISSIGLAKELYFAFVAGKTPSITIKGTMQTLIASVPFSYTVAVAQDLSLKKKVAPTV